MINLTPKEKLEFWIKKSALKKNVDEKTQLIINTALNIHDAKTIEELPESMHKNGEEIFLNGPDEKVRFISIRAYNRGKECFWTTSPNFMRETGYLERSPSNETLFKDRNRMFLVEFETTYAKSIKRVSRIKWSTGGFRRAEFIKLFELHNGQNIIFYLYKQDEKIYEGIDVLSPDGVNKKGIEKVKKGRVPLSKFKRSYEIKDFIFEEFFNVTLKERIVVQTPEGSLASGIINKGIL